MRWMTRSNLHLDRMATSWLIRRRIDREAEILFLGWDEDPPSGDGAPILFGLPGVELSSHDEDGTAFAKAMRAYGVDDPAVARIERVVDAGVRHALGHRPAPDQTEETAALGTALDYLGEGFGIAFADPAHLEAAMAIYDGLYALFQARLLPEEVTARAPQLLPERIGYLREALGRE
jgi:hypothetical protein